MMKAYIEPLLHPERLYTAADVIGRPSAVPARPGVYGWYFDEAPPHVDVTGCHRHGAMVLLYVGISPKAPPSNGRAASRSTLRQRLRTHYAGNAEGSTLRRTLGCLLGQKLGIDLRRVGSGTRYTLTNPGERVLDGWMHQHAFVTWVETDRPWEVEEHLLLSGLRLPLNMDGNPWHEAVAVLRTMRLQARLAADQLSIVARSGRT